MRANEAGVRSGESERVNGAGEPDPLAMRSMVVRSRRPRARRLAGQARRAAGRVRRATRRLQPGARYPAFSEALSNAFPRPGYLLRLESLAFVIGDHPTALWAARRRATRLDAQSLFIALVSEWESGSREQALGRAEEHRSIGGQPRLVAATRFYQYLEMPERAQAALDAIADPDPGLVIDVGLMWRRHGAPLKAIALFDRALSLDPSSGRARRERDLTEGERRLVDWNWARGIDGFGGYSPHAGRVLHMVSRSLPHHHAGSSYRTHYIVAAQRDGGIDAHAVTECGFPRASGALNGSPPTESYKEVTYRRLPDRCDEERLDQRLLHHVEVASSLIEELRPALLHPASDYRNATVALALRERFGIPVVYEVRGFPEEFLPRRPGSQMLYERFGTRRAIEAECWRRADRVVTLAEVMKRHIAAKGVDPDRIVVVPNAVDAECFRPAEPDSQLAARLGIRPGETVLGYVSSLTAPYEGVQYLIEAVAELTRRGKRVRALLVGEGTERPYLADLATRLGVGERVIFTGHVDHDRLPSHLTLMDVFVVPRTAEATTELVTPLKPFEAMAMEKAVLVSGTEALREMVREGETGLTFEPEDVDDLVATLEPLIEDPASARELGRAARQWVIENRSWNGNVERYRRLYAELGAL